MPKYIKGVNKSAAAKASTSLKGTARNIADCRAGVCGPSGFGKARGGLRNRLANRAKSLGVGKK